MTEWKEAFCPMCGLMVGKKTIYRSPAKPYMGIARQENRWETIKEFTDDRHFGVVKSSEGRGTMKFVRYYEIDEDEDGYFPPMKARLLAMVGEWIAKGLITREEVDKAIV